VGDAAKRRVVDFLSEVLNVEQYPLTVMDRPIESETCKIVENSYRATILAFLDEWSVFAETNGVDLIKVIKAIKVRPTHSNMIFPGPGIGGYCLPKDGGLGLWALAKNPHFEFTVKIRADSSQKVVSSGPYRLVRHPGYLASIIGAVSYPLIVGSWAAYGPASLYAAVFVARTALEDRALRAELPGYKQYAAITKSRLLPGVW
jgi:hypothetical protein